MKRKGNQSPYFSPEELRNIGFSSIGPDTEISRKCSFYKISGSIGEKVRIDDFCVLKGELEIGAFTHLASFCIVTGTHGKITLGDCVGLSAHVSIYSGSDDYNANALCGPQIPEQYTAQINGPITIGMGSLVGPYTVILPGKTIGKGASIGAHCMVAKDVPDGGELRSYSTVTLERRRDVQTIEDVRSEFYDSLERCP